MQKAFWTRWGGALLLVTACNGGGGADDGRETSGGSINPTIGGGATDDAGDASGGQDAGEGEGDGGGDGGGQSDDSATQGGSADDGGGDSGVPKFDLGIQPDIAPQTQCEPGGGGGGGGGGMRKGPDFSYLWAANSTQGTISKIDTETVTEVGRFQVRPDGAGSPSRTAVSLSGNVAVASRSGGVTKFYASIDDCVESNGTPGIQTSMNNAALPWDQEECRAWHTPFGYSTQRPVAWGQGEWNYETCQWENELLWTAGRNGSTTDAEVLLMDGDDGTVLDSVIVNGLHADIYGIYGAAVDAEGNFWGSQLSGRRLIKVNLADMTSEVWTPPVVSGYGMTVDVDGFVWICASTMQRFDPATGTWAQSAAGLGYAGCMADGAEGGLLWTSTAAGVIRGINRQTLLVEQEFSVPGSYGISIDFNGYIWAVANSGGAHRVDPVTGAVQSYNGLVGAYTYSDMTGAALSSVSGTGPTG
ncbi:MAG: hypothetical protein AAGA54_23405 [Myxococcota bacterium]